MYSKLKFVVFYSLVLFISSFTAAQSFTVEMDELSKTVELGTAAVVFEVTVTNNTTSDLSVYFKKTEIQFPEEWSCAFCLELCYPDFVDSVATTEEFYSNPLTPGEERLLLIDVFPNVNEVGVAIIELKIGNVNDPDEFQIFNLTINTVLSGVDDFANGFRFELAQNYPNPFNPSTTIKFDTRESGNVRLVIYDILGREIAELINGYLPAGSHQVAFDSNTLSRDISSGIYFYKITAGTFTDTKKMILEK